MLAHFSLYVVHDLILEFLAVVFVVEIAGRPVVVVVMIGMIVPLIVAVSVVVGLLGIFGRFFLLAELFGRGLVARRAGCVRCR